MPPLGAISGAGWLSTGRISPWPGWKYVLLSRTPSLRYQTRMPLAKQCFSTHEDDDPGAM